MPFNSFLESRTHHFVESITHHRMTSAAIPPTPSLVSCTLVIHTFAYIWYYWYYTEDIASFPTGATLLNDQFNLQVPYSDYEIDLIADAASAPNPVNATSGAGHAFVLVPNYRLFSYTGSCTATTEFSTGSIVNSWSIGTTFDPSTDTVIISLDPADIP